MTRPDRYAAAADEYAGHPTPPRRPETVVRMLVDKAGYVVGGQFRVKDRWVSPAGSRVTAAEGENGEPDFHTYIRSTRREVEPEVIEVRVDGELVARLTTTETEIV